MPPATLRTSSVVRVLALLFIISAGRIVWAAAEYFYSGRTGRHRVETAWMIAAALAIALSAWLRRDRTAPALAVAPPSAIALAAFLAVSLSLYWPVLGLGLLSDDYVLLARSGAAAWDITRWEFFRPVPLAAMQALHAAGGAPLLHGLNVLLHGCNGWLLYCLAARLGLRREGALLAAALFLSFPAGVEAVAWSSGLFDVSMVGFGLGYLLCAGSPRRAVQAAAVALLLLAMLSKETAVALPAVALLLSRRLGIGGAVLGVSLALAAAYALFRVSEAQALATVLPQTPWRYAVKEILVRPFASLAVPWTSDELARHPFVLGVLPAALLALAIGRGLARHRGGEALVYAAWVVVGVGPLFGFFFVADDLQGSRYLYLPLCGWSLLLPVLADLGEGNTRSGARVAAMAICSAMVALGAWGVHAHLGPWREAAALRDRMLAGVDAAVAPSGCRTAAFEGLPLAWRGAHLFRNGFAEAVAGRGVSVVAEASADCRFAWNGREFVRQP